MFFYNEKNIYKENKSECHDSISFRKYSYNQIDFLINFFSFAIVKYRWSTVSTQSNNLVQ